MMAPRSIVCLSSIVIMGLISVGGAAAGCSPAQPAKAEAVDQFRTNPELFLADQSPTNPALRDKIASIVGNDPALARTAVRLITGAPSALQRDIAAGLGLALASCSKDPASAQIIQTAATEITTPELLTVFLEASRDVQTFAVGIGSGTFVSAPASPLAGSDAASPSGVPGILNAAPSGGFQRAPAAQSFSSRSIVARPASSSGSSTLPPFRPTSP